MKVELLDARAVSKRLKKLIVKHDEIHVAVAWGYNGPVADRLLQNVQKFCSVTFGVAFCQTDPDLVDQLVGIKNAFIADGGSGTFHPKLYYFRSGDKAEAIVGSSNFTSGGLHNNREASLYLKGQFDESAFAQIRALLETYEPIRKPVTIELAKSYRLQAVAAKLLRKPKNPILAGHGKAWRQITSSLATMEWGDYLKGVRSGRYHVLGKRLDLLRTCQRLFAKVGSFTELSSIEWKAIAGVIGEAQKRASGLHTHDWGWFGSMKGMGDFANRISEQDKWLARAVDTIPRHGNVSKAQFEAYCGYFLRAFENSHRIGGVPTATRLLAMKRPDTFVCVSKPNTAGLAEALSFARTTLDLNNYWERIIEPVQVSPWYNADRPTGEDAEIWDGRVAMLDAIYYDPS